MRLKWSTGIIIAIVAFIGFIMSMVTVMLTDKKFDHDLVTEEYYQKELGYQTDINSIKNAKQLKEKIKIEQGGDGLKIVFPSNFNNEEIRGSVFLYRPSNKQLDTEISIKVLNSEMIIPQKHLVEGRWDVSIVFKYQEKTYLHEEQLNL